MKEIGGYYGLEQLVSNEYYSDLCTLNTGRNALLYLIRARGIEKVYIPYYLCDSISDMLLQNHCQFEYYHIGANFFPMFTKELRPNDYLYVVNYYGQLINDKVESLRDRYGRIILDNTHAFFQRPNNGIDTIYSCRKFFGVPDGAYLSTECILDEELEVDVSKDRMIHILGRFEGLAADHYDKFKKSDELFKSEPLKRMSKLTKNILGAIDYEQAKRTRNKNYAYLENELGKINKLRLVSPEGAFSYPFYYGKGSEVRKRLATQGIYISTLWPNVLKEADQKSIEFDYAANILPLPCDQRYTVDDMRRLVHEVLVCVEE